MRANHTLAVLVLLLFMFACADGSTLEREQAMELDEADAPGEASHKTTIGFNSSTTVADANGTPPASANATDPRILSSSAARETGDSLRRFIRQADLRFRVKDVAEATYAIEDIVAGFGGWVADTRLASRIDDRHLTPISADSSLETTRYTVTNTMNIRVPNTRLDTVLKSIARHVDFLDHRTVTAEDVHLALLANRMAQERAARHGKRLSDAIDEQGRKLRETVPAEDRLRDSEERADQAKLANLGIEDRIAFGSITLNIYQRQALRREMLPNEDNIKGYEPGFLSRLWEALTGGWNLLVAFMLFLARSWSLLLLAVAAYFLIRWLMRATK